MSQRTVVFKRFFYSFSQEIFNMLLLFNDNDKIYKAFTWYQDGAKYLKTVSYLTLSKIL